MKKYYLNPISGREEKPYTIWHAIRDAIVFGLFLLAVWGLLLVACVAINGPEKCGC